MVFSSKLYKYSKTKSKFYKIPFFLLCNGKSFKYYIKTEQNVKEKNLNCSKILNAQTKIFFNKSIFKHLISSVNGLTIILEPTKKTIVKRLCQKDLKLLQNLSKLTSVKIYNKIKNLPLNNSNSQLNYYENNALLIHLLKNCIKYLIFSK